MFCAVGSYLYVCDPLCSLATTLDDFLGVLCPWTIVPSTAMSQTTGLTVKFLNNTKVLKNEEPYGECLSCVKCICIIINKRSY